MTVIMRRPHTNWSSSTPTATESYFARMLVSVPSLSLPSARITRSLGDRLTSPSSK